MLEGEAGEMQAGKHVHRNHAEAMLGEHQAVVPKVHLLISMVIPRFIDFFESSYLLQCLLIMCFSGKKKKRGLLFY